MTGTHDPANGDRREPTFDADGYPTDQTTETIRTWDVNTVADAIACMDYVGRAWKWPEWGWSKTPGWRPDDEPTRHPVTRYLISTGGWSGNEELYDALDDNVTIRMLGWQSSRRGGHFEYRFAENDSDVYGLPRDKQEVAS